MSDIGLTHIALPVSSLEASIAFYGKFANMRVVHSRPRVVWLSDQTRPFVMVLFEMKEKIVPLSAPAHLGVGVASRQELEKLCHIAQLDGCLADGPQDSGPPVGYWAELHDPDGHVLELAFGQQVGLAVESANA